MAEIKTLQTALLSKTQEVQEQLKEEQTRTASPSQKTANGNVASEMIKVGPILTLPCVHSVWSCVFSLLRACVRAVCLHPPADAIPREPKARLRRC